MRELLAKFIAWRINTVHEKRQIKALPKGAEVGFTDELFVNTGRHHLR